MLRDRFTDQHAETMALEGLGFLAGRPDELERFLSNSGLDAAELRSRAADRDVLRAVVEFLLGTDELVTAFCAEHGFKPQDLHLANHRLGGA